MKTIFMKKADWEKWDASLRSDKYKQGVRALEAVTMGGKFHCCLGVLEHCLDGEVEMDADGDVPSKRWLDEHGILFTAEDNRKTSDPLLPGLACTATTANDNRGRSFIQIADAIKECVEFTDETPTQ